MLETVYLTKSKVRGAILGILFSNPGQKYYLSELARLVGASAGNVQRELARFIRDELILREKKGKLIFYVLNTRHALFPEIRSLVLKTVGIEGELRSLVQKDKDITLALLYGSFARKEEKGESDIDLLVVSDAATEKLYTAIQKLEARFHREINPTVYSRSEFHGRIAKRDTFIAHILKQPYRALKGDVHEFQKAAA